MIRLVFFELSKIWKRKRFILSIFVLVMINLFLLWYTNLSDGIEPGLNAYKAFEKDIQGKSEKEKKAYVEKLYQDMQGIRFVNDVVSMRAMSNDMGEYLAESKMAENPGVFEKYYKRFQDKSYLKYTDSDEQEENFINEIYEEMNTVYTYRDYLNSIQENKENLQGISIFAQGNKDNFSARNIEKSASDYEGMEDISISFYPSKGIVAALKNEISDVLLILSVFLLVSGFIYEEKEKKLFYITRASAKGRGCSILSKLAAEIISCITVTVLIYGVNLIFFELTTGLGDLTRSIQSVAPLIESCFRIRIIDYIVLTLLTKALILFVIAVFLTLVAIISKHNFVPYLAGGAMILVSALLYYMIPAYAKMNWLKYLNIIGLLRTENIYGGYLNFNLFEYPVSRFQTSGIVVAVYGIIGIALTIIAFKTCSSVENKKVRVPLKFKLKSHNGLLRHEGYKIFVMNKAGFILLIFMLLIGYRNFSIQYSHSAMETYYQNIMLKLEGSLNSEKETFIEKENARYEEAFYKINEIDEMVDSGQIDSRMGDSMKEKYYSDVAFYPAFKKVLKQYAFVKESKGKFVYDTGYLYLFGVVDTGLIQELLLITICIILAFGNVLSMEWQKNAWNLISATAKGRNKIVKSKIIVSVIAVIILTAAAIISRVINICQNYPLHSLTTSIRSIPQYMDFKFDIPIFIWICMMIVLQLGVAMIILAVTIALSGYTKTYLQTVFVAVLIFAIPLVLQMMGFEFAKYCSLFPIYRMFNIT